MANGSGRELLPMQLSNFTLVPVSSLCSSAATAAAAAAAAPASVNGHHRRSLLSATGDASGCVCGEVDGGVTCFLDIVIASC